LLGTPPAQTSRNCRFPKRRRAPGFASEARTVVRKVPLPGRGLLVMDCGEFLKGYSDYSDGLRTPEQLRDFVSDKGSICSDSFRDPTPRPTFCLAFGTASTTSTTTPFWGLDSAAAPRWSRWPR
jgi:hypothetical protein